MDRRRFLKSSGAAVAAALVPGVVTRLAASADSPLRAIRGGVGVFSAGRGGTIAWLVTPSSAVVVDTKFADSARECLSALRAKTTRRLDAVLNTHHHGDHVSGNGVFRPEAARIVAHRNVPDLQRKQSEERGTLAEQVYADTLFDTDWKLDLDGEVVRGRHFGPAHTGGDAVFHFEKANVAHVGDLVFRGMVPYTDRPGGCRIAGWIDALERVAEAYPKDTAYVFGHIAAGRDAVGERAELLAMRDYLTGLAEYVRKGRAAGKSVDELAAAKSVPGFESYTAAWDGAVDLNVRVAWAELAV